MKPGETNIPPARRWFFLLISLFLVLAVLAICLVSWFTLRPPTIPAGMLPREADAITRALGPSGLDRVIQVISPNDQPSLVSGGTHMMSGYYHGKPYGLAFDIAIVDPLTSDEDVHKLRMQGIAAWRRGPGAPGGAPNLGPHIHCVWPGAPTSNIQNREQISSFVHHYKGIVESTRNKDEWKDPTITAPEIRKVAALYTRQFGKESLLKTPTYESRHHAAYMS